MGRDEEIRALKDKIAPDLLAIEGVGAVGADSRGLNVYLVRDSSAVRERVEKAVRAHAGDLRIQFVISGDFRVQ
jgi:hypothetical protein